MYSCWCLSTLFYFILMLYSSFFDVFPRCNLSPLSSSVFSVYLYCIYSQMHAEVGDWLKNNVSFLVIICPKFVCTL